MNFFYDLNKKLNSIGAAPESTQLNERDLGKHNNATTGFAALAKKAGKEYGSKAAGERVAGAQLAKMREKGQVEEMNQDGTSDGFKLAGEYDPNNSQEADWMDTADKTDAAQGAAMKTNALTPPPALPVQRVPPAPPPKLNPTSTTHPNVGAFNSGIAPIGANGQPMRAVPLDELTRLAGIPVKEGHCSTCNCSPCSCNEGNAFSGAVVKAKRDGIQPGETVEVGGNTYPVKEQGMSEGFLGFGMPKFSVTNPYNDDTGRLAIDGGESAGEKVMAKLQKINPQLAAQGQHRHQGGRSGVTYFGIDFPTMKLAQQAAQALGAPNQQGMSESTGDEKFDSMMGNIVDPALKAGNTKFEQLYDRVELKLLESSVHSYLVEDIMDILKEFRIKPTDKLLEKLESTFYDRGSDVLGFYDDMDESRQGMSEAKGKKPDFLDLDKDGDKKESMKKAAADKKKTVKEEDGERKTTHGTERTKGNITTHTRNYEPDVEDDDDFNAEPRKAGRPKGTKHATGAKGPTGKSKLQNLKAIREEGDTCPHCGAKKVVDERSVSQAQAHMMAGAAHNPKFAKKVGVKQSVAKEFNKADTGKDIGKLPKKVKEADAAPAAEKAPSNKYSFGKGIYDSLNRQVDNLITEGMSVTVNMSTDDTGQPHKDITVHADGDDAAKLAELLNLAGIHRSEQSCSSCGQSPCGCGGQMVDENSPSNEPDPVFASVDQVAGPNTGGGIDGPHTERNENNPGDNPMAYKHPTPDPKGYMPGATNTYNESKQADLGMSLYKELQQFKGK